VPDRRVFNLPADLYRAYHHFTGVNPDAGFKWIRSLSGLTLAVFAQLLLYVESRIERTL
jgi:hypothetical protein